MQVTDLQRQRNEVALHMEELAAEHAAALQPMIASLRVEVAQLQAELETEKNKVEQARIDLDSAKTKVKQVSHGE